MDGESVKAAVHYLDDASRPTSGPPTSSRTGSPSCCPGWAREHVRSVAVHLHVDAGRELRGRPSPGPRQRRAGLRIFRSRLQVHAGARRGARRPRDRTRAVVRPVDVRPAALRGERRRAVRLFVAVVPPAEAIDHLDRAAVAGAGGLAGAALDPDRAVAPDAGVLRRGCRPRGRRASSAAGCGRRGVRAALDLRFAGAGTFGDRVLWVGVQGDRDGLRALAGAVSPPTAGPTGRTSRWPGRGRVPTRDRRPTMLAPYDGPAWRAAEVVLFRSHLGPKPRHEPLARWPLPADPPPSRNDHGSVIICPQPWLISHGQGQLATVAVDWRRAAGWIQRCGRRQDSLTRVGAWIRGPGAWWC